MSTLQDPAEILVDGLQDLDDRASAAGCLLMIYRSIGLPEWVAGAKKRMVIAREDRDERARGNVQRAFQAFLEAKGVFRLNRLKSGSFGHKVCYETKSAVCHIQRGCDHGK